MSDFAPPAAKLAASPLGALGVAASPTLDLTKLMQGAAATGSLLRWDGTNWAPTSNIILDDPNKKITLGGDWSVARSGAATGTVVGTTVMPTVQPTTIQFSGDTVANLYRASVGVVKTDGALIASSTITATVVGGTTGFVYNPGVGGIAFQAIVQGEANNRFNFDVNGTANYGAGGASAPDLTVGRGAAAGMLKVSKIGGGSTFLQLDGGSGIAEFQVDTSGNLLYNVNGVAGNVIQVNRSGAVSNSLVISAGVTQLDPKMKVASVTTARTGGAAAAPPANPVRYLAMQDENGNRMYVPAYS